LNMEAQYDSRIGVNALRSHILEWAWNTYFNNEVPKLFKSLTQRKVDQDKQIRALEVQMAHLNIRGLATQYTSRYLQLVQQVLAGTAKGNPLVNGETLKEELDEQFSSAEWDHSFTKDIPFQSTKLYGGQQFERLFNEFKAIAINLKIDESDLSNLPTLSDKKFFNSACESATSKVEYSLLPLIEQLIERAVFIMKRVPNVVESILTAKDTKPNPRYQSVIDNNLFSPISAHFRDLFSNFIEKAAKTCKLQCMEEFFGTKTVYWYMSNNVEAGQKTEEQIFSEIFGKLRDRIVKNVLRKVYNFFLVPFMQIELWEEIQAQYFTIDSVTLDELLEIHSIEDFLDHKLDEQERVRDKLESDNDLLNDLAPRFQN